MIGDYKNKKKSTQKSEETIKNVVKCIDKWIYFGQEKNNYVRSSYGKRVKEWEESLTFSKKDIEGNIEETDKKYFNLIEL